MAGNHRKMDRRIKVNGDRSSCDVTWAGLEVREESSIGAIHPTGWRPMTPRSSGGGASASLHQVSKEQDPTPRRRYTFVQVGSRLQLITTQFGQFVFKLRHVREQEHRQHQFVSDHSD